MYHFYKHRIFPNLEDTSSIRIEHTADNQTKPLCVFGVLCTERGLEIEKEMMEWLSKEYNVFSVYQDAPGKYYEYPALRFMQYIMTKYNVPYGLYLHTKGAFNHGISQRIVRNMWRKEFVDNKRNYLDAVKFNKTSVVAPLTGLDRNTWFNGFFATKEAMELAPLENPEKNRYFYEALFKNVPEVKLIGLVRNLISAFEAMQTINKYR